MTSNLYEGQLERIDKVVRYSGLITEEE